MSAASPARVMLYANTPGWQCTLCRAYFLTGTAWKRHRKTGKCCTARLVLGHLGAWVTPRRIRVKQHNISTTRSRNRVQHTKENAHQITYQKDTP